MLCSCAIHIAVLRGISPVSLFTLGPIPISEIGIQVKNEGVDF